MAFDDFSSRPVGGDFTYGQLPDEEKRRLCRDLLSEFGVTNVQERGQELIHSCPLPFGMHQRGDIHPSAALNWRKLTFICRSGCGSGGLLWFIATCRGIRTQEARSWLAKQTGVGDVQDIGALLQFFDALYERGSSEPIPKMNVAVLEPWYKIHPYLTEIRHIPEQTLMRFHVGWDPGEDRIIIPHFWRGDLVGWQSRRLVDDGSMKYRSTPSFPKSQTLYNYDPDAKIAVVVEAPLSVLAKDHLDYHMEATFGATITDGQVRLMGRHPKVILFFDTDKAGWSAVEGIGPALTNYCDVWVANNDYAADPADMSDEQYLCAVEGAVPWSLWTRPTTVRPLEVRGGVEGATA